MKSMFNFITVPLNFVSFFRLWRETTAFTKKRANKLMPILRYALSADQILMISAGKSYYQCDRSLCRQFYHIFRLVYVAPKVAFLLHVKMQSEIANLPLSAKAF